MVKRKRLGTAFSDQLIKVRGRSSHFSKIKESDPGWESILIPNFSGFGNLGGKISQWNIVILSIFILASFFGLFLKLFDLQVVNGFENRDLADSNRVQIRVIHAPRGVIYDRNGKVLAENNPGFRLKDQIISRDQALTMEAKNDPGTYDLEIDAVRFYPEGEALSHVLGYVGKISQEELNDPKYKDYKIYDRVGRAGIEVEYENVLKGKDGAEIIEVDAQGKKLRTLRTIDPIPGNNIYLSIDSDLQKKAYQALKQAALKAHSCCGAEISENPSTGEVLSLVSIPSFDNNIFTDPSKNDLVTRYFNDPKAPLLNRAIGGEYPPGSTFKITTALAGLSSGKLKADTMLEDTGVLHLGPYSFANWYFTAYGKTDGNINVIRALQRSNDVFFYQVGDLVGENFLGQTAQKIGMGQKIGIDLPGEATGLVPTDSWKEDTFNQVWYPGDTLHFAIGQGYMLATPLQILNETVFIANGGRRIKPQLVTKITDSNSQVIKQFSPTIQAKDTFPQDYIKTVQTGLSLVTKPGGTAGVFFNFPIPSSGKTGTAEFGNNKQSHAWYTGFAPTDDPKIATTVLIEAGGEGSVASAPVVKDIFTDYFNLPQKDLAQKVATASANITADYINE